LDSQCCKKCKSGFVKNVTCPTDIIKHCVPCEKGKEFMNHLNDLDKCKRCKLCDSKFGWEVVRNCTPEEDTQCTCAKDYFCSSETCDHCIQCTICESGVIEKQCTPASDTVCGTKEEMTTVLFYTLAIVIPDSSGHQSYWALYSPAECDFPLVAVQVQDLCQVHSFPFTLLDVDLSSHVPGIVAEMTLAEVKKFVRHHHVSEPSIDQAVQDCPGDTSEQKIRLFRVWYQSHGMRGAYGTLIRGLRELKMCAAADKIEENLRAAISSSQEGERSYNPDTEQSKTCTREGRNSYNDSAELSKAYTGTLEET
ncbi:TNR6 factor, partial [Cisticola juncidis]|nr:TNR6 factor [Cisticola juncidis]